MWPSQFVPNFRADPYRILTIVIPLAIVLMAIPLQACFGPVFILAPLVLAALCYFVMSSHVRKIEKAVEQKHLLDMQLIQSQKLAAIGELSAGIAHEINNPLAIMAQEVEWARHQLLSINTEAVSFGELKDSLDEIARQVERCGEITHRVLDFARKRDPLFQSTEINKLVDDMAKLVEKEVTKKGICITRQYCKDLPSAITDPPLLRQVVLNLLNNAAYATKQNGAISIRTGMSGNAEIEIEISDTGCGISSEVLDRIFDPFFTTKPPGQGTGLGLSLSYNIMERLDGTILVESELGKGSIFTVKFPLNCNSQQKE
jgi:two-component system NtrC family sensor kinase